MTGELSPASVYVSLLPVVEACVVVAVPGRVGEVRVAADEPEAVDLDCPVPLTVRGTQALVSFAPLAFKLFFAARQNAVPVSYTHLTLPTILLV